MRFSKAQKKAFFKASLADSEAPISGIISEIISDNISKGFDISVARFKVLGQPNKTVFCDVSVK